MTRSTIAVVAGFLLWSALWIGFNQALAAVMPGSFDEDGGARGTGVLILIVVWAIVISIAAGSLTARLAPGGMKPVVILAVIQLVIGLAVQITWWDRLPAWFHLTFLAALVPCHLLGGRLRLARSSLTISKDDE